MTAIPILLDNEARRHEKKYASFCALVENEDAAEVFDFTCKAIENVIAERMPTDEQITEVAGYSFTDELVNKNVSWKRIGFIRGAKWFRSRMEEKK